MNIESGFCKDRRKMPDARYRMPDGNKKRADLAVNPFLSISI